jgi:hypothetical protein
LDENDRNRQLKKRVHTVSEHQFIDTGKYYLEVKGKDIFTLRVPAPDRVAAGEVTLRAVGF